MADNTIKRRNLKYQSGSPLLPEKLGDRHYSQDGVRDLNYVIDFAMRAMHTYFPDGDIGTAFIISQGAAVASAGNDLIDAPSVIGFADFDVEVPLSFAAFPPTKQTETRMALIISVATNNIDLTTTGQITPNLFVNPTQDGATTNYVKVQYLEEDGSTRDRAKAAGSWAYEVADSYQIIIDAVAPTTKDIQLGTFLYAVGGAVTVTAEARSNQKTIQQTWDQTVDTSTMELVVPSDQPFPGVAFKVTHGDGIDSTKNILDLKAKQAKGMLDPDDATDGVNLQTFQAGFPFRGFTFVTASGNFNVPADVSKLFVEALGGGGGGGSGTNSGGGGGGEKRLGLFTVVPSSVISIVIGAGGLGGPTGGNPGGNGGSTIVGTPISITALGGVGGDTNGVGGRGGFGGSGGFHVGGGPGGNGDGTRGGHGGGDGSPGRLGAAGGNADSDTGGGGGSGASSEGGGGGGNGYVKLWF